MPRCPVVAENLRGGIPVVECSAPLACRHRNKWSSAIWQKRRIAGRDRAGWPHKIAPFPNDRADLCKTRNMGKYARRRGCERRCDESWLLRRSMTAVLGRRTAFIERRYRGKVVIRAVAHKIGCHCQSTLLMR